jgi:hypothetical protein
MNSNKLIIGLAGNDELKEKLASVNAGDTVTFEVTAALDEQTPEQAVFSVAEAVLLEEPEAIEETEEAIMGEYEEAAPSAAMLAFGKGKPPAAKA